jgi:hypothetical protein
VPPRTDPQGKDPDHGEPEGREHLDGPGHGKRTREDYPAGLDLKRADEKSPTMLAFPVIRAGLTGPGVSVPEWPTSPGPLAPRKRPDTPRGT